MTQLVLITGGSRGIAAAVGYPAGALLGVAGGR